MVEEGDVPDMDTGVDGNIVSEFYDKEARKKIGVKMRERIYCYRRAWNKDTVVTSEREGELLKEDTIQVIGGHQRMVWINRVYDGPPSRWRLNIRRGLRMCRQITLFCMKTVVNDL